MAIVGKLLVEDSVVNIELHNIATVPLSIRVVIPMQELVALPRMNLVEAV